MKSLYVVQAQSGLVKIGIAKDPAARLEALQTGSPEHLALVHTHMPEDFPADAVERAAHDILRSMRRKGEWFEVSVEQAIDAIQAGLDRLRNPKPPRPETVDGPKAARAWRDKRGFTRDQLAELIGHSASTIRQMELGHWANGNPIEPEKWTAYRLACAAVEAGAAEWNWQHLELRFGDVTILRG